MHLILDEIRAAHLLKSDDTPWRLQLVAEAEQQAVYGDTWEDLARAVIVDYPAPAPQTTKHIQAAFAARRRFAVDLATAAQGLALAAVESAAPTALALLTARQIRALTETRERPVAAVGTWRLPDVPLVIAASSYSPFSRHQRPVAEGYGEVIVIDDLDDESLIRSAGEVLNWHIEDLAGR